MPSSNYSLFHLKTILLGNLFWKPFYYEAFLLQFFVLCDARDGRVEQERDTWWMITELEKHSIFYTSLFQCNILKSMLMTFTSAV